MKKSRLVRSRLGFTLIELLIVIVIIGILSVAFLPTILNGPKKARDATRKANLQAILQAIQATYIVEGKTLATDYDVYADDKVKATFPNNTVPTDPGEKNADGTPVKYGFKYADGCIALSADTEIDADNANSSAAAASVTKACAPTAPDTKTAGNYFVLTLKY